MVSEADLTKAIEDGAEALGANEKPDSWKFRRRMVFGSVIATGVAIVGLALFGDPENTLHRTLMDNGIWAAVGIIGVYIGAPVVDDWLQKKASNAPGK